MDELKDNKFFSAVISSLYTNLSIKGSIKNILELANEYKDKLDLFGMNLRDLEELIELGFGNAFFTYNIRMYYQKRGLFMGYLPCPKSKIAVIQVYSFERQSIYGNIDCITDITKATHRRYMDDAEGVALNEEQALLMLNAIADQDPSRRISWELDFQQDDNFVPFLDVELYIDNQGVLHSRYYRKPQKKAITLNAKSHQSLYFINEDRNSEKLLPDN